MRALRRRNLAAAPLALILVVLLPAARPRAEQLPIKTYTTADGLSQDRVKRIVRDSRGFLWFCTADGLSRFDGYRFTSYDAARGLPHPSVNDLLETRAGTYWVATNGGGVARFHPSSRVEAGESGAKRFVAYAVGDTPRTNRVNKLYEDGDGRVWAGTDDGLFLLEGDGAQFRRVGLGGAAPANSPVQVWDLLEDGERNLWVGTTAGLLRRTPDGRFANLPVEARGAKNVWGLMKDGEGRLWVSYAGGLLVLRPAPGVTTDVPPPWREVSRTEDDVRSKRVLLPAAPGEAYRYTGADGLAGDDAQGSYRTRDGRIWVVTTAGLTELSGGLFRSYTTAHGLIENTLLSLAEDRDGNVWIGTYSGGAMKLTLNGLTTYRREDGLSESVIRDIFEDQAGELCVAGRRSIDRFDGKKFTPVRPNLPADAATFDHVIQDHVGEWWFAAAGRLYRFPRSHGVTGLAASRPRLYTAEDGLGGEGVQRLFEDSRGDIWIGTGGREVLSRWERATGQIRRYSKADGLPEYSRPLSFSEDAKGGVWVGFREGGLARYRDGRFTALTSADGLPAGDITRVFSDAAGRLWAAVTFGGLVRIDDPDAERPRFRAYTIADGLTSNITRSIIEDRFGRLYVGTTRSVDRVDPADGRVRHYTVADGLASNESNTSYADRGGALWFGTWNGLSRLVPAPERTTSAPPPVLIGGLSVAGEPRPLSELGETEVAGLLLGDRQNHVRIDFFGLSFAPGEVLRYQYMLEGAGGDWGAPTDERSVTYANLRPGSYRFLVRAVNADGVASERPASVT
ncbi:MAG TPA: two-component regulator propeller domain-containing protein, partial [Pyrinomonadaceae bacterium]